MFHPTTAPDKDNSSFFVVLTLTQDPSTQTMLYASTVIKKGIPCFRLVLRKLNSLNLLIVLSIIHFVVDGKYGHVWLYAYVFYDAPFVKL